jgi:hypothetical protein
MNGGCCFLKQGVNGADVWQMSDGPTAKFFGDSRGREVELHAFPAAAGMVEVVPTGFCPGV